MMTKVAAIVVVLALAALSGYALFSGPTKVPAPPTATEAQPAKAPPTAPGEGESGEPGDGR